MVPFLFSGTGDGNGLSSCTAEKSRGKHLIEMDAERLGTGNSATSLGESLLDS